MSAREASDERLRAMLQAVRANRASPAAFFKELHAEYGRVLKAFVVGRGISTSVADDVCQETWAAAAKAIADFREDSMLCTWLFGIAHHKVRDLQRRERPIDRISGLIQEIAETSRKRPSRALAVAQQLALVDEVRRELPPEDSLLLSLHFDEERKASDIAKELGISTRHVARRLVQARDKLQKLVEARL